MSSSPAHISAVSPAAPTTLGGRLITLAGDIKIQHTVFAMPWALLSAALAGRWFPGTLTIGKIGLVLICMVVARTVAMTMNRLLDAEMDARNPRTARRAIPAGTLSRGFVIGITLLSCAAFVATCAAFEVFYHNPWPLCLAVPVLVFLSCYPLLKRFTRLCHYYLGMALALAPLCAWIAITGKISLPPLIMFAAVLSWTAGFDIIYACQDYESDLATGTFSIPAKLGIRRALWVSRLTHAFCAAMLILLAIVVPQFSILYYCGAGFAIALLIAQQSLVTPSNLSKVNLAFFTINGVISLLLGALGILDLYR
ncbi:MAG: putative 4-hydroxybenzoate polyprenyltransferase [Planctomycetota bacterium]|nr:putative 4-hydroxybenzoate polyprenyltransferase [Planctomycetota bacterium]